MMAELEKNYAGKNMIDGKSFCNIMQINGAEAISLQERWESLTDGWVADTLPCFLDENYFAAVFPHLRTPFSLDDALPYVRGVLRIAKEHPEVALLGHILCKSNFELKIPVNCKHPKGHLPFLGPEYSGMFSLMIAAGIYPYLKKAHGALHIPEKYTLDTLSWIGGTTLAYAEANNGIPGREAGWGWMTYYVTPNLFRIGRLEYWMHTIPDWLPLIYTNDQGDLKVLCRDGWKFRADGRLADPDDEVVNTAYIHNTAETITGIRCNAAALPDFVHPVTLKKSEWHCAVSPWDLCPSLHIPACGRMPFEEILASMKEAVGFFNTYFNKHVPLFCCNSWILNPGWEIIAPDSNMVRFRKECYATPTASGKLTGMGFLFGRRDVPPDELPIHNRAQQMFVEGYRRKLLGAGSVFVMTADLDKLGNEYYRREYKFS